MDQSERAKYKQLANDSIIATFGRGDTREQRLAEALEAVLNELDRLDQKPHCATCHCDYSGRE